jgi:hypothetical protein
VASATLSCPKCGFRQNSEIECQRCGIIFDRYNQGSSRYQPMTFLPDAAPVVAAPNVITRFFRLLRWTAVFAGAACLILILSSPTKPPSVPSDVHAGDRFAAKMERLGDAAGRGGSVQMEFDEAEVNAWLRSRFLATMTDTQHSRDDVRLQLMENRLRIYVLFNYFGAALTLITEGQISVVDHHLGFMPTSGQLGSLPLPPHLFVRVTRGLFYNLQLPPAISGVTIQRGILIVSSL